jgi:hypothetical protein
MTVTVMGVLTRPDEEATIVEEPGAIAFTTELLVVVDLNDKTEGSLYCQTIDALAIGLLNASKTVASYTFS